jgi:hypothetical protein
MKLIYIRATMVPKNHSALRSILKQQHGEKIAPCILKPNNTQAIKQHLDEEKIIYEIYQEKAKRPLVGSFQQPRKKRKVEG